MRIKDATIRSSVEEAVNLAETTSLPRLLINSKEAALPPPPPLPLQKISVWLAEINDFSQKAKVRRRRYSRRKTDNGSKTVPVSPSYIL